MAKEVQIKISGDTSKAKATIGDLKTFAKTEFNKMQKGADKSGKEISGAFKQMGIRTTKEIQASSNSAKQAFMKIKRSGVASANDVKRAHNVMTQKIKANNREMKGGAGKLAGAFAALKGPLVGLLAIGTGIKLFKDMTGSALENEIQVRKLRTQVENLGFSWDEHNKSIDEAIQATSKYAIVQSGDVSQVLQQLLFVTGDLEKSQTALNTVYDLAHLKGLSVEASTEMVGRALSGNVETLGRYFIEFKGLNETLGKNATLQDKAAFAMAFLNERVSGSIENLTKHERTVRFVKNEWSSFVQLSGEKIFPVLDKIIILIKQTRIGFFQVAKALLFVGKGFTWLSDKLGITKDATQTFDIAMDDLEAQIKKSREKLDDTVGATDDLTKANDAARESSEKLAEEIKKRSDAMDKAKEKTDELTRSVEDHTIAVTFQQKEEAKRAAFLDEQFRKQEAFRRKAQLGAEEFAGPLRPAGFKEGGKLPGYGGGDRIPVLAEAGEYIIKKEAVRNLGINALNAINRMDVASLMDKFNSNKIQKFKEGGLVQGQGEEVSVNLLMGDKSFPMKSSKDTAGEFVRNIKRLNIVHSRRNPTY